MTTETLLPPNATQHERALEQGMRCGLDVVAGIGLIRTAKETPPDDWLYWLIWEYGLEELLPYQPEPRAVLEKGIQWQRLRGTPESLNIAFEWVALGDATIEEEVPTSVHWYEFQLDPGKVPTRQELLNLVGLARLSAPVGTHLSRIYHEYDYRHGEYDRSKWSDGSLYSADSGVYDPVVNAVLSFGRTHQAVIDWSATLSYGDNRRVHSTFGDMDDKLVWCRSQYDELPFKVYPFQTYHISQLLNQGAGRNLRVADGVESLGEGRKANAGPRDEVSQYPATHYTQSIDDLAGWGPSGWGERTWNEVLE